MTIELKDLLKGQSTQIKGREFFSTEAYITPFIERMSRLTDDFVCRAIEPTQLSISSNGEINTIYNKVLIEACMPSNSATTESIGMAYAIDARKPICKFYRCIKDNSSSGHLYIDSDRYIVNQPLEPESTLNYSLLDSLMDKELTTTEWMNSLEFMDFNASNDEVNYKLGQWIRFAINFAINNEFGSIKIATNDIIAAYRSLFEDMKSPYSTSLGAHTTYANIYDAFSKIIYDGKDIVNLIDKTYLLKSILSIA